VEPTLASGVSLFGHHSAVVMTSDQRERVDTETTSQRGHAPLGCSHSHIVSYSLFFRLWEAKLRDVWRH